MSLRGITDNQLDAPFSTARANARPVLLDKEFLAFSHLSARLHPSFYVDFDAKVLLLAY